MWGCSCVSFPFQPGKNPFAAASDKQASGSNERKRRAAETPEDSFFLMFDDPESHADIAEIIHEEVYPRAWEMFQSGEDEEAEFDDDDDDDDEEEDGDFDGGEEDDDDEE